MNRIKQIIKQIPESLAIVAPKAIRLALAVFACITLGSESVFAQCSALSVNGFNLGGAKTGDITRFDGVSQRVEIPNAPFLNVGPGADFSINAWVRIASPSDLSGIRVIVEKRMLTKTSHYKGYSFYLTNGSLGLQLADDATSPGYSNYGSTLAVPADGNWHFVAVSVTRTNSSGILFTLDNRPGQKSNPSDRQGSLANSTPLRLGMRTIDTAGAFKGTIDQVGLFHRAVPPREWESLYAAKSYGKCRPPAGLDIPPNQCLTYFKDNDGYVYSFVSGVWDQVTKSCRQF